jgi:arylsulfatase A-like enzyme
MRHGLGQNELYPSLATVPECQTLTAWTAEQCVDYIRERRDPTAPFFLWCSFSKPHPPLDPPEPYYSMYRGCAIPPRARGDWTADDFCPPILRSTRKGMKHDLVPDEIWREARAAYYGLVTQIDYTIGRVLGALQETGLYGETLILFTSDHGELLGDHDAGGKCYFYEGSAHVPFILRAPRSWGPRGHGLQCSAPVTLADVLPTLVDAAGGRAPATADGVSLLPLLEEGAEPPRKYVVGVGGANVRQVAITDGRWKYLWFPQGGREQLFDLAADPYEQTDQADSAPMEGDRLRRALIEELVRRGSDYLADGRLAVEPVERIAERDLRAGCGQGFATEYQPSDTRH